MKQHLFFLLVLGSIALWVGLNLFHPGWFISHDGIFHLRRAAEMVEVLKTGIFPVRYAPTLDNNFGVPLFNYIYPGPYYLAAIPNLLLGIGLPTILKCMMFAAYFGGALGWYSYFVKRPAVAWVTGLVSLLTPYLLVNIYVRGALGEILVLGLLPWALLSQKQILESGKIQLYSPIALTLVFISHNVLGYLFLPLLLLHLLTQPKFRLRGLTNVLLSLALASFFWLPMISERKLLLSGANNNFSFYYGDHFVAPWQLLNSPWGYGYSEPGTALDGFTFQLGYAPLWALGVILIYALFGKSHWERRQVVVGLGVILLVIFVMTKYSLPLWHSFLLFAAIQFPWRLLGIVAVTVPFLLGVALSRTNTRGVILLGAVMLLIGLYNIYPDRSPKQLLNRDELAASYAQWQDGTTTSYRNEIIPRWATTEHLGKSPEKGQDFTFVQETSITSVSTFPKNYFPSWQGEIDGQPLALSPASDGQIAYTTLAGKHTYHLFVGNTLVESLANWLSIGSLAVLLYLIRYTK